MSRATEAAYYRAEVEQGTDPDTLAYWLPEDEYPYTTLADVAVTLKSPTGEVLVSAAPGELVEGRKLQIARAWPAEPWELREDYIAAWTYTIGGAARSARQFFDVVLHRLDCPVITSDLLEYYPDLLQHLQSVVKPPVPGGVNDAAGFIRRAWGLLLDRLRASGHRPALILDRSRLVNPSTNLALNLICEALVKEPGDVWERRSMLHLKNYEILLNNLGRVKYDTNQDGQARPRDVRNAARKKFHV